MTKEEISAFMREMGRKGGRIGGKRRLETMSVAERRECATKAARARWGHLPQPTLHYWPVGTRFWIVCGSEVMNGWVVTHYTMKSVFFYKPEYDGDNKRARKTTRTQFESDIRARIIGKE